MFVYIKYEINHILLKKVVYFYIIYLYYRKDMEELKMDDETIVCMCMNVSVKDIKDAIAAGDTTFSAMQDRTGLGTVCGVCVDEAEEIFNNLLAQR